MDALLDRASISLSDDWSHCTPAAPCGQHDIDWLSLPPGCDPCNVSAKMAPGTARGERKRESVSAMAWLLSTLSLDGHLSFQPTIVDAGCGTGSLLLPLAALFPNATFVGVDCKAGSLERLRLRADAAGIGLSSRVVTWEGRIEDYDGPADVVLSLHACGGASDAALHLASERRVPYGVSPCCIGKLRRGPASGWLRELLLIPENGSSGGASPDPVAAAESASKAFSLVASWADSEHVVTTAASYDAPGHGDAKAADGYDAMVDAELAMAAAAHLEAATRRARCKTLVELDRLIALHERQAEQDDSGARGGDDRPWRRPGRLLRITGAAMATSGQAELLAT